jgi:hypothetical protein
MPLRLNSQGRARTTERYGLRHLVSGDLSDELTEGEQLAQGVARQLCVDHRLADELYREAETSFGTKGLIEYRIVRDANAQSARR